MSVPVTLGAELLGAIDPGRVSLGKLVPGECPDQEQFMYLNKVAFQACGNLTWKRETGAPSWSQVWEGRSLASVWWPDFDPWNLVRHSPKK